jgi:hypothetical protein
MISSNTRIFSFKVYIYMTMMTFLITAVVVAAATARDEGERPADGEEDDGGGPLGRIGV